MYPQLTDVKKALSDLGNVDQEINALTQTLTTSQLVSVGQQLWWIVKKADKALDVIKKKLREQASGVGSFRFDSNDGSHCIVLVPAPKAVLRKDVDIQKLKKIFGVRFPSLFEEVISYKVRKDYEDAIKDCSNTELEEFLKAIDISSDNPRVNFKD